MTTLYTARCSTEGCTGALPAATSRSLSIAQQWADSPCVWCGAYRHVYLTDSEWRRVE